MDHLLPITSWLPMSLEEAAKRGWDSFDIILVSGDAYIDHPSFGIAVIGRVLEALGYRVGIISQPNWRDDLRDFRKLGKPRLFFGVSAGNMDSMVNHYTAFKRLRSDDAYTAGGVAGFRPDYASAVYSQKLKSLFPDTPVVLGGVEASMRRAVHYDYWSDTVMPGILVTSGADMLVYGMGEKAIAEVAAYYDTGGTLLELTDLRQIAFLGASPGNLAKKYPGTIELPSFEECRQDTRLFAEAFRIIENESNRYDQAALIQRTGGKHLIITPPYPPSTSEELDAVYALPFTRLPHPRYKKRGGIPAYEMIKHSVTIHRGCFGGCSFCTISMHQGKFISSRSEPSILKETETIAGMEGFKGVISDLGGPSANMYRMGGIDIDKCRKCSRPSCIWPRVCHNLEFDHGPLIELYRKVSMVKGIKKVFIGSGVRFDMLVGHKAVTTERYRLNEYAGKLIRNHVSGRLKVAPEHSSPRVLQLVRKPGFESYMEFRKQFLQINRKYGLNQQLIPYLIASLPGCDLKDMAMLASDIALSGYRPEQVQDFTPTPMTLSNVIYHTGTDPYTGEKVYVAKGDSARRDQRKFLFWHKQENREWIIRSLKENGQAKLIKNLYRNYIPSAERPYYEKKGKGDTGKNKTGYRGKTTRSR